MHSYYEHIFAFLPMQCTRATIDSTESETQDRERLQNLHLDPVVFFVADGSLTLGITTLSGGVSLEVGGVSASCDGYVPVDVLDAMGWGDGMVAFAASCWPMYC